MLNGAGWMTSGSRIGDDMQEQGGRSTRLGGPKPDHDREVEAVHSGQDIRQPAK